MYQPILHEWSSQNPICAGLDDIEGKFDVLGGSSLRAYSEAEEVQVPCNGWYEVDSPIFHNFIIQFLAEKIFSLK